MNSCLPNERETADRNHIPSQKSHLKPSETKRASSGGVIDGNGGEFIHNEHNPWFVGEKEIPYCIKKSKHFSVSVSQASREIAGAFAAWKDILVARNFTGVSVSFENNDGNIYVVNPNRDLALDFKEVPCDDKPPLVFKLGILDEESIGALKFSAHMTVGFALRTEYDDVSGIAQGFVWLTPDRGEFIYQGPKIAGDFWKEPQLFRNVILHEIGHIFGLQHIPKTIMDANIPAKAVAEGFNSIWNAEEFRADFHSGNGYCGIILHADEEAVVTLLNMNRTDDITICLQLRHDLRGNDRDTPMLLSIKNSGNISRELLIKLSYNAIKESWIQGIYSEIDENKVFNLKKTLFGSFEIYALYRGILKQENTSQAIEIEMPSPGIIVLHVPGKEEWGKISIVPPDRKSQILKIYQLLEEEE